MVYLERCIAQGEQRTKKDNISLVLPRAETEFKNPARKISNLDTIKRKAIGIEINLEELNNSHGSKSPGRKLSNLDVITRSPGRKGSNLDVLKRAPTMNETRMEDFTWKESLNEDQMQARIKNFHQKVQKGKSLKIKKDKIRFGNFTTEIDERKLAPFDQLDAIMESSEYLKIDYLI